MILPRDDVGLRSETVRRANLSAIVRELNADGPLSRSDLVARTGLTRSAIRGLIGELAGGGLVVETSPERLGTPGRPSPIVRTNPEAAVVLALEISVDSFAAAIVGLGGTVLAQRREHRPRGHTSVGEIVADLRELARPLLDGETRDSLVAIGVAIAGVVRRSDGRVAMAPNLGWRDVSLRDAIASAFGDTVPILVANEADLGALAEQRRGAAVGVADVLFVSGEVGVGGGLIVDGRPLTGSAGYGGEVGHLPVNVDGARCGCGSIGCWETEIGERALLARAGHDEDEGPEGVDAVLAAASAGDSTATAAIGDVGRWIGIGLAGLVNVLNPRLVVLGGLFARLQPFVADVVDRGLDERALPAPRGLVRVVPAALGVDAPLLGAAELALEPLVADPAAWLEAHSPAAHAAGA